MTIPIIFVLDSSGSMYGEKINAVNTAMYEVKDIYSSMNIEEDVIIGVITFSTGIKWITDSMVDMSAYDYTPIIPSGMTELGCAIEELGKRLTLQDLLSNIEGSIGKPIIVFMSDGFPCDFWEKSLVKAEKNPWFSNAAKFSIAVGYDADESVMGRLTVPTTEVDISCDWSDAARCVRVHTPDEIISVLKSIFYHSVSDGYSLLEDSSVSKTRRIFSKVIADHSGS